MNPVVGLDVAKEESQVQAFLDQSKPYGKSFSMKHTKEELDQFLDFLKEVEEVAGCFFITRDTFLLWKIV
ncbi:hypothetical protein P4630_27545 [Peribacillus simplex]|uniref:hypothetical protein n=1 Tax=Peribacillus simplex TaxID=1478 RepID=UPI002E1FBB4A|nr:hypothetical protein [Peribacillus simplex]